VKIESLNGNVAEYQKLVQSMQRSSLGQDYPLLVEALSFEFFNADSTLVAYDNDIKGGLIYGPNDESISIVAILSLQKGIGRKLMQSLENCVKGQFKKIALATNSKNIDFFKKLGYSVYVEDDEILMEKNI
jgi:hypothetical protein